MGRASKRKKMKGAKESERWLKRRRWFFKKYSVKRYRPKYTYRREASRRNDVIMTYHFSSRCFLLDFFFFALEMWFSQFSLATTKYFLLFYQEKVVQYAPFTSTPHFFFHFFPRIVYQRETKLLIKILLSRKLIGEVISSWFFVYFFFLEL